MSSSDRSYSRSTTEILWIRAMLRWDDRPGLCGIRDELHYRKRLSARILRWSVNVRVAQLEQLENDPNEATEELSAPTDLANSTTRFAPEQPDEEFDEDVKDYVQASVVTLWGKDNGSTLVRSRRGFLLDEQLVVTGSFNDDESIATVQIVHRGDDLLGDVADPTLPLDVHEAVDLRLYIVDRREMSSDWEMVTADITPPNVGR